MRTFIHIVECPQGHEFEVRRRHASAGFVVDTHCPDCDKSFPCSVPNARSPARVLLERDIEARLVQRVKQLGGEVRKVQWVGRNSAPDRIVMLPAQERMIPLSPPNPRGIKVPMRIVPQTIWVELKAPGLAAKFPRNAHERAQQREHERMRKMGQVVHVIDSFEAIERILK